MNMPNSLPPSVTNQQGGLTQRVGNLAKDAAPTLGAYINIIRARKWMILALTLLITALAAVIVSMMTPIYRASTTILIENNKKGIVSFEELYGVPAGSREFFQTQAEFMKSREVAQRVINTMGLDKNVYFDPRQKAPSRVGELLADYPTLAGMVGGGSGTPREFTDEEANELTLARFQRNLDIVPVRLSQLVESATNRRTPSWRPRSRTRPPKATSRPTWMPASTCSRPPANG